MMIANTLALFKDTPRQSFAAIDIEKTIIAATRTFDGESLAGFAIPHT